MNSEGRANSILFGVERRRSAVDLVAVLVVACATAIALRGHFIKPHIDFFDFYEVAHAFQHGHLATTLKRAPVYPSILAVGGWITGAVTVTERPPMQVFAEWLNAVLLPVNAALVWLIGRRWLRSIDGDERIAALIALWFCCLPWGVYCTAHLLLEPLLVTTVLATVFVADHRYRWTAYALAAVAIMVRYDVAGLVGGILLADILSRRQVLRSVGLATAALIPLATWLILTTANWHAGDHDHYVSQLVDHAMFDPLWACRIVLDVCFNPTRLSLPTWIDVDESALRAAIRVAIVIAFFVGCGALARPLQISRGLLSAAGFAVGYIAVHSIFPFQWERFGYPLAPLALVVAACGFQAIASWIGHRLSATSRAVVCVVLGLIATALLGGEYSALPAHAMAERWKWILGGVALGTGLLAAATIFAKPRRLTALIASALTLAMCAAHTRDGVAALGTGDEARHIVELAQWIAHNTTSDDVVISPIDSVLRLYADDPGGRFVPYSGVHAEEWTDILAECRSYGIRYLAWYDGAYAEHAHQLYRDRWQLERFSALDGGCDLPKLRLVWRSPNSPHAYIWELLQPP